MRDRSQLITKLCNSRQSRESYVRSKLNVLIPSQIRALRLKYPLKQKELAEGADMKQSRISAMERPGQVNFSLDTLIRVAAALKVALKVEFVTFSEMLDWENDFSQDQFDKAKIENDRAFLNPIPVASLPVHATVMADTPSWPVISEGVTSFYRPVRPVSPTTDICLLNTTATYSIPENSWLLRSLPVIQMGPIQMHIDTDKVPIELLSAYLQQETLCNA